MIDKVNNITLPNIPEFAAVDLLSSYTDYLLGMFEWLQNWLVYHVSQVWKTLLLWFVGLLLRGDNVLGGFPELYLGSVATTWYLSVLSLLPECTHDSTGCCGLIWPHTVDFNIFTGQIVPPGNVFEFERVSLILPSKTFTNSPSPRDL